MMDDLAHTSIQQLATLLRDGTISPIDLVESCLRRIEQLEPRFRAWVNVDSVGARQRARRLADELTSGQDRGPLHGIPIGVKDIIDVASLPTRAGSPLTDPTPAANDAQVVAQLRAAGAIILGKTVTCEWACFDPSPTRNPWNTERTPGGSSSGSAVAVALGMCFAALGTQTGGSVTRPAAYCGVVGWKPAHDALSLEGVAPVSARLDHVGVLARSVADAELVVEAASGNQTSRGPHKVPARIARPTSFFFDQAAPEVVALIDAAIGNSALAGAVEPVDLPASFSEVHAMHRRIMAHDCAQAHAASFSATPKAYGPNVAALIEEGQGIDLTAYDRAVAHQTEFTAEITEIVGQYDAWITPATPSVAPGRATTGDPKFNSPWSYCGLPTISVPVGFVDGLPIAVQLIGCDAQQLGRLAHQIQEPCQSPPDLDR